MTKFDFSSKPTVQEMQTWNKRYKLGEDTTRVIDTFDDGEFWTIHPNEAYNLCITLNEQHEQINILRECRRELISANNDYRMRETELAKEVSALVDENEELKNKIDILEDDNETYHKSLETLNLYTKRFIPTKCTNEFKDCKTNRYYWLDHEGNFEGCLELLNLLDCKNEGLKFENRHLKARLMEYEEQIKR